ncbi:MAG TPA: isoprenylcysteine carboxylmethyltransferase family protein [Gaiellaceae bacterium]|nr:isoprenylcysteine carboxylmethyltransferase family protein [Gaiellaceae bacterium]
MRAAVVLPGTVAVVVPALLVWWTGSVEMGWGLPAGLALPPVLLGLALMAAGAVFVVWTVRLFARRGRGTLAPWDPTSRLVVEGPYRHVRNPMISGVGLVLAGEAVLLGSPPLALWPAGFALVNAVYMPLVEEPGLARRFGAEYETYRANVPRWLPRLRPWAPPGGAGLRLD